MDQASAPKKATTTQESSSSRLRDAVARRLLEPSVLNDYQSIPFELPRVPWKLKVKRDNDEDSNDLAAGAVEKKPAVVDNDHGKDSYFPQANYLDIRILQNQTWCHHLLARGIARARQQDNAGAAALYRQGLALDHTHAGLLVALGAALANGGHYQRAVATLEQALAHHPSHVEAQSYLDAIVARQQQKLPALAGKAQRHQHDVHVEQAMMKKMVAAAGVANDAFHAESYPMLPNSDNEESSEQKGPRRRRHRRKSKRRRKADRKRQQRHRGDGDDDDDDSPKNDDTTVSSFEPRHRKRRHKRRRREKKKHKKHHNGHDSAYSTGTRDSLSMLRERQKPRRVDHSE